MAQDLLNQPTNSVLSKMSFPIGLGMLSTILFQVVDTYFVGTLGAEELTALSFASTVYFLLIGLYIGISIAVAIMVGKAFGEGDQEQAKRIATVSLLVSFVVAAMISLIGSLTIQPLFEFLGATEAFQDHIASYMLPMYVGMPILTVGIVAGSAIRSSGNVKPPEIIMGIAGIINIVLDYLFIYGKCGFPSLGIAGVAYGTVISWGFVFVCMLYMLIRDNYLIPVFSANAEHLNIVKRLGKLGLPSIVTQLMGPITLMFIIFLLGKQSPDAVAAYGVAARIETLLMIGVMAVSTAVTPFIAQNLGANNINRIDEAIVFSGKASFFLGVILVIVLVLFIHPIASLFSDQFIIIKYTSNYFYLVCGSYVLYGLYIVTAAIFNGLQLPGKSVKVMLVKTLLFTVPLPFIGSLFAVEGIYVGLAISNVIGGLYARNVMRQELKKVGSSLVGRSPFHDILLDVKRLFRLTN